MAPEVWNFADLIAAGWTQADLDWEAAAEAAMACLAAGQLDKAREQVALSLRIAVANFARDDPRLGTSLANQAARLAVSGDERASAQALSDAVRVWRAASAWIAAMTAPRTARSSLFHLRMEQRHRKAYEERWRQEWVAMTNEARIRLEAPGPLRLLTEREAADRHARWRRKRPAMLNDTRKLLAAVLLLACERES